MIGQVFGRLKVVSEAERGKTSRRWVCECSCGGSTVSESGHLRSGHTTSCGCWHKVRARQAKSKHGFCGKPEYTAWRNMIDRCYNEKRGNFKNYGGRGISVCERWRESFDFFFADMGEKPFRSAQIDRVNNSKGYSPDNCKWSTVKQNGRNRRNNVKLEHEGENKCISEWAEIAGIRTSAFYGRIKRGWPMQKALTEPLRPRQAA